MTDFIIKKLPYNLTSNAGLALVGQYMKRLGGIEVQVHDLAARLIGRGHEVVVFTASLSKGRTNASRPRQAQPERLSEQYWIRS